MWDDIIIGKGEKGNSSWGMNLKEVKADISQNSRSYWISDCFLSMGMTIFKDSAEGKKLSKLIKDKKPNKIDDFLDTLVVDSLSPKKLKECIKESNDKHFESGKRQARREMREALGITGL